MELDNFKRNFTVIAMSFASTGYIFSIFTSSISVILLLASSLIWLGKHNFRIVGIPMILSLIPFLMSIGLFYTPDISKGLEVIVRHLSFLIAPFCFLNMPNKVLKQLRHIPFLFTCIITLFIIVVLSNAIYRQIEFSINGGSFNWYFFYRYDLLEVFKQHPTYVSMYVNLGIYFVLFYPFNFNPRLRLKTFFLITLSIGVLLTGSRMGYVVALLLLIYYLLWLKKGINSIKIIVISVLFLSSIWFVPIIRERILFTLGVVQEYNYNDKTAILDGSPEKQGRLLLWHHAIELIEKKPIFGFGVGGNQIELYQLYKDYRLGLFLKEKYNAHNTYLEYCLIGGIVLLMGYVFLLTFCFYTALKYNNRDLLFFTTSFFLYSFTESLIRIQGIVFIAFFLSYFLSMGGNKLENT